MRVEQKLQTQQPLLRIQQSIRQLGPTPDTHQHLPSTPEQAEQQEKNAGFN